MHTHSLFELNEHIRRVLALNFQQAVWITAELAQVSESRGHRYLDLVQKGGNGDLIAQAQAAIWASEFRQINARFPLGLGQLLREGLELRMQVRPEFHERYGLKLHITDIDPAFTLGQLDLLRRQTIQTLREAGLYDLNRQRVLPPVLQRIAVVSSENAAGLQDFREHLEGNSFGYVFDCQYFTASVQGKNAEADLIAALKKIELHSKTFDCIAIVRGGGAKLDLMAFDGLELCKIVAKMSLPVLTGIGHDINESVMDLIAHTALKTPTAVADFLIHHNLEFEGQVLDTANRLQQMAQNELRIRHLELDRAETTARFMALEQLRETLLYLGFLEEKLPVLATQILREHTVQLENAEAICQNLHPEEVLRRGYSITTWNGKALSSAKELQAGDRIETRLREGVLHSEIVSTF